MKLSKESSFKGQLSPNVSKILKQLFAQENYPERNFTGRMYKQEEKSKQANSEEKLVSKG